MNWQTEKRKINDLIPYEQNPRQMSATQVENLKKSLEKFNLVEIPAIDTDNRIIAGHQRLKIMQLLGRGEEEIDVRVPDHKLTDEEFKEYNIRSNKNIGDWDFDELANSFETVDLLDWGFNEADINFITGEFARDEEQFKEIIDKFDTKKESEKNEQWLYVEYYQDKAKYDEACALLGEHVSQSKHIIDGDFLLELLRSKNG